MPVLHQGQFNFIYDCRQVRNPYSIPALKPLTGLDPEVSAYVLGDPLAREIVNDCRKVVARCGASSISIGFFCMGGRHRSPAVAMEATKWLLKRGHVVTIELRDIRK